MLAKNINHWCKTTANLRLSTIVAARLSNQKDGNQKEIPQKQQTLKDNKKIAYDANIKNDEFTQYIINKKAQELIKIKIQESIRKVSQEFTIKTQESIKKATQESIKKATQELTKKVLQEFTKKATQDALRKAQRQSKWMRIGLASSITALVLVGIKFYYQRGVDPQQISQNQKKHIFQKYGKDDLKNKSYFHAMGEVKQRMENIIYQIANIKQNNTYPVILILGGKGIGKTSTAKEFITKIRSENKQAYYFNLEPEQTQQKHSPQSLIKLLTCIQQQIKTKSKNEQQQTNPYIFLDDVNLIENEDYKKFKNQLIYFIFNLQRRGARIILISSSSSFFTEVWQKSQLSKLINKYEEVVWKKYNKYEQKDIIIRMAKSLNMPQIDKIAQMIAEKGFGTSQYENLLADIHKSDQCKKYNKQNPQSCQSYKKKVQEVIQKKNNDQFNLVLAQILQIQKKTNIYDKKFLKQILKSINQSQQPRAPSHQLQNCLNISGKLFRQFKKELRFSNISPIFDFIKQLDLANQIIYGHPRTQAIKNYYKRLIENIDIINKQVKNK